MAAPHQDICSPWADLADIGSPCNGYDADTEVLERMLRVSSYLLFMLSFRRYPGICRETVRPCAHSSSSCGCGSVSAIVLPSQPVVRIYEVKVDGVALPDSAYRVDNYRELVRVDSGDGITTWPCWQDQRLADSEQHTWSVTYDYGLEPPEAGVVAAAALACQLSLAFAPGENQCRLPKRITSMVRQGVAITVLDPMDLFDQGRTGIVEVDLFLAAERLGRKQRPATARRLGMGRRARRCTSC